MENTTPEAAADPVLAELTEKYRNQLEGVPAIHSLGSFQPATADGILTEATVKAIAAEHAQASKQFRKDLDEVLQRLKGATRRSRERSIAITKLQEAIMWLGMDLKALHQPNPYPESYNPASPVIEPTADGLKL